MENTSKEYSKTELQRLNQNKSQIKVHEIIDEQLCNDDSMVMNIDKQASVAIETSESLKGEVEATSIKGKTEVNDR